MKTHARHRPATAAESRRALADLRQLFQVSPRMKAEARFERAKAEYTDATEALMRQDAGSIERADAALEEFTAARAALALMDEEPSE
jgi:hypothetical protein